MDVKWQPTYSKNRYNEQGHFRHVTHTLFDACAVMVTGAAFTLDVRDDGQIERTDYNQRKSVGEHEETGKQLLAFRSAADDAFSSVCCRIKAHSVNDQDGNLSNKERNPQSNDEVDYVTFGTDKSVLGAVHNDDETNHRYSNEGIYGDIAGSI